MGVVLTKEKGQLVVLREALASHGGESSRCDSQTSYRETGYGASSINIDDKFCMTVELVDFYEKSSFLGGFQVENIPRNKGTGCKRACYESEVLGMQNYSTLGDPSMLKLTGT